MKTCPTCRAAYPHDVAFCPLDGAPLRQRAVLEPGTVIRKKYEILSEIGRGGQAVVYRARHLLWNEDKAIKLLLDLNAGHTAGEGKPPGGLLSEALVVRQLEHPNVVRMDDADFTEDDQVFVVMEYVEGKSLQQLIEGGPLPWRRALRLTAQACAGLAAAHRKGIVHRDIKPRNLLLTSDADDRDVLKLIDFGIAKMREDAGLGSMETATGAAGFFIGTPEYASPEQAMGVRGSELDASTDLYSLGLVLFEMLTGVRPFAGDTLVACLFSRLQNDPQSPRQLRPELEIPQLVSDLALKAIAREKQSRYGSAEEMQRAIADVLEQLGPVPGLGTPGRYARKPAPWILLSAGIALAIALASWLHWYKQSQANDFGLPARNPNPLRVLDTFSDTGTPKGADAISPPIKPVISGKPISGKKTTAEKITFTPASVNAADGLNYLWVEPGKFMMGCSTSDSECIADESPAHEVTITRGFRMGETEVTQAAYQRVMGNNPSSYEGPELPVDSVSWMLANSYCRTAGLRLPTEAEWEFAARAGSGRPRYGNPGEIAWWSANSQKKTHDVAGKQPNGYGLRDMLGNVAEWTADWYGPYEAGPSTDPRGASEGQYRILRGGSWFGGLSLMRVSARVARKPGVRGPYVGFRCAGN